MYHKRTVFWAACMGMLLFGLGLITLGSMAPELREKFGLDEVEAGTLFSILPIGVLAGSLLFGPVCDRYGYKWMLVLACVGLCAGFEGIALSASTTVLKIFVFLFGLCAGIINGATNAVVSDISKGAEGANLSLLGVFFGIGALGMPFITGALKSSYTSFDIVKVMGLLALATGIFYSFIQFPPSKKLMLPASTGSKNFLKDPLLYMIAFFLFFQGSMEAILNNWTTTYFTEYLGFKENVALYALSLYLAGMTVMRLLIGSVLRSVPLSQLMFGSMGLMLGGILLVAFGKNYFSSVCGLTLCGVGLAAGFPIMLGMAGSRYASNSATAFSIILTIALVGNMLVNILMGFISGNFGIRHLTTVFVGEWLLLVILAAMIFSRREKPANNTVAMEKEITV